jgi:hypothetical protein
VRAAAVLCVECGVSGGLRNMGKGGGGRGEVYQA